MTLGVTRHSERSEESQHTLSNVILNPKGEESHGRKYVDNGFIPSLLYNTYAVCENPVFWRDKNKNKKIQKNLQKAFKKDWQAIQSMVN